MEQVIKTISEWVWSPVLVVICLMAGLYFSIGTRFVQVRRFREMARLLFAKDKSRNTGVSSFQAFSVYVDTLLVCTATAVVIWAIGDTGVGAMAWINVIAILLLSPKAFKALKSYERQKKEGKGPVFNPEEIGVKEAVYWDKYNSENLS